MELRIALAGNPNCGKTTLFNALTGANAFVGNWPGVTVEKKEGRLKKHEGVILTDLPGIYSLSPYTLEEVVARNYLVGERPDAILAVSDMYAAAVVKAATSEGIRIPDDLALIGFDNTYISQMSHPSVAAVSLPRFQLGYMACEVLSERIMNPASDEPRHFLLETELVLRDSV